MSKQRSALVVGAAHLDVIADYSDESVLDAPGTLSFSIGGSAYNIAMNLGRNHRSAFLLTFLKRGSLISPLIQAKLHAGGVSVRFVTMTGPSKIGDAASATEIPSSGFVAHRFNGNIVSAVTSSHVEGLSFASGSDEHKLLVQGMKARQLVVADTNLSTRALVAVLEEANTERLPVVISVVSERKITRVVAISAATPKALIVFANQLEIASLNSDFTSTAIDRRQRDAAAFLAERMKPTYITALCNKLHAGAVGVTYGAKGASICLLDGTEVAIRGPLVDQIESQTGSGDAYVAAIVAYLLDDPRHRLENCPTNIGPLQNVIDEFVAPVLKQSSATWGASLDLNQEEQTRASAHLARFVIFVRDCIIQFGFSRTAEVVVGTVIVTAGAALLALITVIVSLIKAHVH